MQNQSEPSTQRKTQSGWVDLDCQLAWPPVAQSFTVELRSLGSSSPSNDFKRSYSAKSEV